MNNFWKDIKIFNILFGQIRDNLFLTKFQLRGLTHDERLLWSNYPPWFEVFSNEKIDKYLTIDQTILKNKFHNAQIH
jgi:hypothetical protein